MALLSPWVCLLSPHCGRQKKCTYNYLFISSQITVSKADSVMKSHMGKGQRAAPECPPPLLSLPSAWGAFSSLVPASRDGHLRPSGERPVKEAAGKRCLSSMELVAYNIAFSVTFFKISQTDNLQKRKRTLHPEEKSIPKDRICQIPRL